MKLKEVTMENWRFLKILKIQLPYDPAIPPLDIYLKKTKTLIWKDICMPLFIAALFTIAKIRKQLKYQLIAYIYIYNLYKLYILYNINTFIYFI